VLSLNARQLLHIEPLGEKKARAQRRGGRRRRARG
jgi:hypothetical protein